MMLGQFPHSGTLSSSFLSLSRCHHLKPVGCFVNVVLFKSCLPCHRHVLGSQVHGPDSGLREEAGEPEESMQTQAGHAHSSREGSQAQNQTPQPSCIHSVHTVSEWRRRKENKRSQQAFFFFNHLIVDSGQWSWGFHGNVRVFHLKTLLKVNFSCIQTKSHTHFFPVG